MLHHPRRAARPPRISPFPPGSGASTSPFPVGAPFIHAGAPLRIENRKTVKRGSIFTVAFAALVLGCMAGAHAQDGTPDRTALWPARASSRDPALEARVAQIVSGMTLQQKIGQMTQADIRWVSPDDVRTH